MPGSHIVTRPEGTEVSSLPPGSIVVISQSGPKGDKGDPGAPGVSPDELAQIQADLLAVESGSLWPGWDEAEDGWVLTRVGGVPTWAPGGIAPSVGDQLITEIGDFLTTEAGDLLVTEA